MSHNPVKSGPHFNLSDRIAPSAIPQKNGRLTDSGIRRRCQLTVPSVTRRHRVTTWSIFTWCRPRWPASLQPRSISATSATRPLPGTTSRELVGTSTTRVREFEVLRRRNHAGAERDRLPKQPNHHCRKFAPQLPFNDLTVT